MEYFVDADVVEKLLEIYWLDQLQSACKPLSDLFGSDWVNLCFDNAKRYKQKAVVVVVAEHYALQMLEGCCGPTAADVEVFDFAHKEVVVEPVVQIRLTETEKKLKD
jgi:hypothetical protein